MLEEEGLVLPESVVINEYLEERYPEPPLWPADPAERALARLHVERFGALGGAYYALRQEHDGALERLQRELAKLDATLEAQAFLTGRAYGLADIAYVPWLIRAQAMLGVDLDPFPSLAAWLGRLAERPAIEAELELVAALA